MNITKKEIIECFVSTLYGELLSGKSMDKLKFIFNDDGYKLFEQIKNNPTENGKKYNTIITDYSINYMKNNTVESEININISDANLFFDKLTELIDLYGNLNNKYLGMSNKRTLFMNYCKDALWLKMTPYDFLNIYNFLDLQINFIKNDYLFDDLLAIREGFSKDNMVDKYMDYDIVASKWNNTIWFETMTYMKLEIIDIKENLSYTLPYIHYGIDNNTCYIYGLQQKNKDKQSKKIERALYKLNKGIENPLNHPSFVLALHTFINMLREKGITNIKVPLLEVLSYSYHKQIGDVSKDIFERRWTNIDVNNLDEDEKYSYEIDKQEYDNFAGKEDFISKAKTNNLVNLFLRVEEQFDDIDIDVEEYNLNVKIKEKSKRI